MLDIKFVRENPEIVKQNIRNYLTTKYDAQYFQELESQVTSYDDWIWEQNNSKKEETEELILDLGKLEQEKQQKRNLATKISYANLSSSEELGVLCEKSEDEKNISSTEKTPLGKKGILFTQIWEDRKIVILAEDANRVTPDAMSQIVQVFCEHPEVEVLYTDEDEVNHEETVRMNPWFKPDYSPDTLLSYFYFGSLVAMSQQTFESALSSIISKKEVASRYVDTREKQETKVDNLLTFVSNVANNLFLPNLKRVKYDGSVSVFEAETKEQEIKFVRVANEGKLILGICLGMQILFEEGFEGDRCKGLGLIKGNIRKIEPKEKVKIPHMGWNKIVINNNDDIINGFSGDNFLYYVHSFMACEYMDENLIAYSNYGGVKVPGIVRKDNVIGMQFHPEKSGETGLNLLKKFGEMIK